VIKSYSKVECRTTFLLRLYFEANTSITKFFYPIAKMVRFKLHKRGYNLNTDRNINKTLLILYKDHCIEWQIIMLTKILHKERFVLFLSPLILS
jgi:hypothetical protein